MKDTFLLLDNPNVPDSFKFQIKFQKTIAQKSYFEIACTLNLLDNYVSPEQVDEDYSLLNVDDICGEFPHLLGYREKLEILKHNYPYFSGLYQITMNTEAYRTIDLYSYCTEHSFVIMDIIDQPIIFSPSMEKYLGLMSDIANRNYSNEIVFWLDMNGYLEISRHDTDTGSGTDLVKVDELEGAGYLLAIASESEIQKTLCTLDVTDLKAASTAANEYELPDCCGLLLESLQTAEKAFTHQIQFVVEDNIIKTADCIHNAVVDEHEWNSHGMYKAYKGLTSFFNIAIAESSVKPIKGFMVINMSDSSHTDSEYELGISLQSIPIPGGYHVTLNLHYSSEYEVPHESGLTLMESKVNVVIGKAKHDPVALFASVIQQEHASAGGSSIIAFESGFPIYLEDINHCSITSNIETFIEYSQIGVEYLIIGRLDSPEIINMALLAAQSGLTVIGYSYSSNKVSTHSRLRFTQTLFDPSNQAVVRTIEDMVNVISADKPNQSSEG